jgi:hypothetical protein
MAAPSMIARGFTSCLRIDILWELIGMAGQRAVSAGTITGHAYGRRATVEVAEDTITWRAHKGSLQTTAENVVTTVHDVRDVRWISHRWSLGGGVLACMGTLWLFTGVWVWSVIALGVAAALLAHRRLRPRLYLVLELADRSLVMKVDSTSAEGARALAERIVRTLASGELPTTPPALP